MFNKFKSIVDSSRNRKLPAQRVAVLFSLAILLTSIVVSIFFASLMARQAREDYKTALVQKQTSIATRINGVMDGYRQLLTSASTLFSLKGDISREEWRRFYEGMNVEASYPSTLGVGYVTKLTKDQIPDFEAKIRDAGDANFTVTPQGEREVYTAITYLEPQNLANAKALGYDMFSEPQRNAAMALAADDDRVGVSAPVTLVQDEGTAMEKQGKAGVLLFYPVYSTPIAPATVAERRAQLKGYVYVVVRPADILEGYATINPASFSRANVTLSDVTDGTDQKLSSIESAGAVTDQSVTDDISLNNRKWTLEVEGKTGFAASVVLPLAVILGGSLMGFALAAFMLRSLLRRIEVVEKLYEAEVERTKDELLALASHQLRTPASGVKQYIGILTSGIMGDLTPAQQQIAEKAYTVNERQIEIINQLLYVSKIEAGKVTIRPQKSDLTAVVRRIIDQLSTNAERKNIKVVFRTKREVMIYGDDQYYPMIIDNLISNAIKYSFPNTTVNVRLTRKDDWAVVAITDHGVGIAEQDREQLFKKFNRIENPLSRSEGGSGLGLFLAYQLARAHGGNIDVKSTIGKGSTFTVMLPLKQIVTESQVDIVDYSGASLLH